MYAKAIKKLVISRDIFQGHLKDAQTSNKPDPHPKAPCPSGSKRPKTSRRPWTCRINEITVLESMFLAEKSQYKETLNPFKPLYYPIKPLLAATMPHAAHTPTKLTLPAARSTPREWEHTLFPVCLKARPKFKGLGLGSRVWESRIKASGFRLLC